ncbi:YncE family protein [Chloroflexota bacterium]
MLKKRMAHTIVLLIVLLSLFASVPLSVLAQSKSTELIGMVADRNGRVHIFNAVTNSVVGTIDLPNYYSTGDVLISKTGKLGFVTTFASELWVIDLTTSTPTLASGTNPIPISNRGNDISITPDGKFLVVSGVLSGPLSIVDIASRTEVSTFGTGSPSAVDVLNDGSVLVADYSAGEIRKLSINSDGTITDTGEILSVPYPMNAYGSPDAQAGFVVTYSYPSSIQSFILSGLAPVDSYDLNVGGRSGAMHPSGDKVYVRTLSHLYAFSFDSTTGSLGTSPLFDIPVGWSESYLGMDQMAITPDGTQIYVPETDVINIYDAESGVLLATLSDPVFFSLTGIYFTEVNDSPGGWSNGNKSGWESESPPGLEENGQTPPGFEKGEKYGWD